MVAYFKPQKFPQDFIRLAFLVNQIISGVKFLLVGDVILLLCRFFLLYRSVSQEIICIIISLILFVITIALALTRKMSKVSIDG